MVSERTKGKRSVSRIGGSLEDHEARIASLEQHVVALTAPAPKVESVTVVIDVDPQGNTAKFARLFFPGHAEDLVNNLDKPHAEIQALVGSTIQLVMEVRGDVGQKGSFIVRRATPTPLTLAVSEGPKSPKLLFVSG